MRIWLDVQQAGATTGPGPVVEVVDFSSRARLNQAGDWRATVPALDDRSIELLQPRRTVLAYAMVNGVRTFIGGGTIEALLVRLGDDAAMLEVSGRDLLEELNRGTVGDVVVQYPSSFDHADFVLANRPVGWSSGPVIGDPPEFVARFVYDTFLGSLAAMAEKLPWWFRLAGVRTVEFFAGSLPSTVALRCVANADPVAVEANAAICLITDITEERQAADMVTRVIAFGSGNGQARLTLAAATQWPDGTPITTPAVIDGNTYSYNPTTNTITNATAESVYGRIERALAWKDVGPVSNTDADVTAAANTLVAAVCEHLRRNREPIYVYSLAVAGVRQSILPGDLVRVQARQFRDGERPINIDRDMRVLEVATTVNDKGVRTHGLTVTTVDYWPTSDVEALVSEIRQSQVMQALPQMSASVDTISYREPIDDDNAADLPFWLGNETTSVNQVLIRFRVDPFRSTAKTVGGTVTGTVDIPDHDHQVAIPAHDHDIPDHQHRIGISQGSGGRNVGIFTGGGLYYEGIDVGTLSLYTTSDSGETTSEDGGGSTETSTGGGGQTGLALDLAAALSLEYGIYEDAAANTYGVDDLEWLVNGVAAVGTVVAASSGWYELDITADVSRSDYRPARAANVVSAQVKAANKVGKLCQITAQIERRTVIQAIAYS